MDKMRRILEAEVDKIPKRFLHRALKKKLKQQGIKDKEAIRAFADHVLSGEDGSFEWDDGDDGPAKKVTIKFTEQDGDEILEAMNGFLEEGLPKVVNGSIDDGAENLVKSLKRNWPEVKLNARYESQHFNDRIDLRWSKGLDPLRMMLIASREVGAAFAEKLASPS